MKNKEDIAVKSWLLFLAVAFLGVAILVKVFVIQIGQADQWQSKRETFEQQERVIAAVRGQILASDGSLLATSVPEYEIRWDSKSDGIDKAHFDEKLDSLATGLSKIFKNHTAAEYAAIFQDARRSGSRYALIKRHVSYPELKAFQELPIARLHKYKSGFTIERQDVRKQPFGLLAARTIGLERSAKPVGVEASFDSILGGQDGIQLQERLAGNVWKPISDDYIQEPVPGLDVVMALDVHLQDIAESTLMEQVTKHNADWGCAVLMEVETGFIKAIANISWSEKDQQYGEYFNHAFGTPIEPGSTFKLVSVMAALESGLVSLDETFDTGKGIEKFYGSTIRDSDWDKGGSGVLSVEEIFEKSSNIGVAKIIDAKFKDKKQEYLDAIAALGVSQKLGIRLLGERPPKVYRKVGEGQWSGISHIWMSIGYEVEQTPLQTLSLYNAVANNGKMMLPTFVTGFQRNGRLLQEVKPTVLREAVCSQSTVAKCRQMMEGVCEEGGTADYIFKNSPYKVAGKTGTAWLSKDGGYVHGRYRASFVGYFPADNPKYSCIVVVNDPRGGSYYGSSVAAPVFKRLADHIYATQLEIQEEEMVDSLSKTLIPISKGGYHPDILTAFHHLNIPVQDNSQSDWVTTSTGSDNVAIKPLTVEIKKVPDVRGMGLKDAIYLLENCGLKVLVEGHGMVKKQSISPGTSAGYNQTITITLS
ncbi:MAG: transpeptidase family protein [Flavobacteriales bacterium]|nr:transpeptidase family protein [Flavobacteriales bacterium]